MKRRHIITDATYRSIRSSLKEHINIIGILSIYLMSATILILATGCSHDPEYQTLTDGNGERYSKFDYANTFECEVTFDIGARTKVYIYTSDPTATQGAEAIRSLYTDPSGRATVKLTLPTALIGKKIYATAAETRMNAQVERNGARFTAKLPTSRALAPDLDYCEQLWRDFTTNLPQGTGKENHLDKLEETGEIAIETIYDNTRVLFTFLRTNGWNSNYMYYYYYRGDDPAPADRQAIINKFCTDKYMCTAGWEAIITGSTAPSPAYDSPDTDITEQVTTGGCGGVNRNFKITGASNYLYFYGEDYQGEPTIEFPRGYKIGFILKSAPWEQRRNPAYAGSDVNYFFTNPEANIADGINNKIHAGRFWTASENDEVDNITRFVYGFEDGMKTSPTDGKHDYNFNDFICLVSTDPSAKTDRAMALTSTHSSLSGTLMYEDLYPQQGDYDMNDVITEYRMRKIFETIDGTPYIKDMYVDLMPVHYGAYNDDYIYVQCLRKDGSVLCQPQLADFKSTFAMNLSQVCRANRELINKYEQPPLHTLRLYLIHDFKICGAGDEQRLTDEDVPWSCVDPFIYVSNTGREVHLTGYRCAGVGSDSGLSENEKLYRAKEHNNGFYPWAMNIPIRSSGMYNPGFTPVTEGINICLEYIKFAEWAGSQGRDATDWYESYTKWKN